MLKWRTDCIAPSKTGCLGARRQPPSKMGKAVHCSSMEASTRHEICHAMIRCTISTVYQQKTYI